MNTQTHHFKSDALLVAEFTKETGTVIPKEPEVMNKEEVHFIIKMVLDEMMELYATVADASEVKKEMIKMITDSKDINIDFKNMSKTELIAEQNDALVDSYYYSLNCAAKKGVNLSRIFHVVHDANMAKKDPVSNTFLKREDGKVIKPIGWQSPDIIKEIEFQKDHGAFTHSRPHYDYVNQ